MRHLLETPFTEVYNLACINVFVLANDELIDVKLNIKHLFELKLFEREDIQKLADLSNKIFFEKFPLLLNEIKENPIEMINIHRLLRLMAHHNIEERHLGAIAVNIQMPHIREMAVEYMAAKAITRVLAFTFAAKNAKVHLSHSRQPRSRASLPTARIPLLAYSLKKLRLPAKTTLFPVLESSQALKKRTKKSAQGKIRGGLLSRIRMTIESLSLTF